MLYECNYCGVNVINYQKRECDFCGTGKMVPRPDESASTINYKKVRSESKQKQLEKLLANAKSEVRRLENGIHKVLRNMDTEDSSDEVVWQNLQKDLIDLYQGKVIE